MTTTYGDPSTNGQYTAEDEEIIEEIRREERLKTEAKRRNREEDEGEGPTSWERVELGPYLRGEIEVPRPTLGVSRSDGVRLLYPGLEHAVVSETEAGKTWIATACAAAEIAAGNHVVYVHYEESDPASTIERLLLLGADADEIDRLLAFVGPYKPVRDEYLAELLDPAPTLVVHDGVNEAMSLHGAMTKDVEGAAFFRQRLVMPFLRIGAAALTCDHFPMSHDPARRDAYGSVHKGNALNGARFALQNVESFGRGMKGRSYIYVTKDRPGFLREHGTPTKVAGKTFFGTMMIDATAFMGRPHFEFGLHAASEEEQGEQGGDGPIGGGGSSLLRTVIYNVILAQPNHEVRSRRMLFALLRRVSSGHRDNAIRDAVDDLLVEQPARVVEFDATSQAKGYRAIPTASQTASQTASPLEGGGGTQSSLPLP